MPIDLDLSNTSDPAETNKILRDHLDQVRTKLGVLKKTLDSNLVGLQDRLDATKTLAPGFYEAFLAIMFLGVPALRGTISGPIDFLAKLGMVLAFTLANKTLDRFRYTKRLASQLVSIQSVDSLIEELSLILREHEQYTKSLYSDLKNGLIEQPKYDQHLATTFLRLSDLSASAFESHQAAFTILSPSETDYLSAPTLPRPTQALVGTRIRSARTIEDLALIQADLLKDPKSSDDPHVRDLLDAIELKAVPDLMAGLALVANSVGEMRHIEKSLRTTPALHLDLAAALANPALKNAIDRLDQVKQSATFAEGDRTTAWRKIIHTTKLHLDRLSTYVDCLAEDLLLSAADKASLQDELRARFEGLLALKQSTHVQQALAPNRFLNARSAEFDNRHRRLSTKILNRLINFDKFYHNSRRAVASAEALKKDLSAQLARWSGLASQPNAQASSSPRPSL